MASITQTIPQYSLGMSEQPDHLKFPGQVTEITNAIPDLTKGLFKRPGAKRIGTNALSSVQSGGSWFHYFRDETEGSYIGQIAADGQVRVWSCKTGVLQTTIYGADVFDNTLEYESGQRVQANNKVYEAQATISSGGSAPSHGSGTTNNWLFIEATSTSQTTVQNYLQTSAPENIQTLTINDTTFVTNRDSTDARKQYTTVGKTGTTAGNPNTHLGFLELLRTENGRQYGINLHGNNTEQTTINRATRIKIAFDTLDESDGTGHCPGIGTQVFSVDGNEVLGGKNIMGSGSGVNATVNTSDVDGGTNNLVTVTATNHGLQTHDQVKVTKVLNYTNFTNQDKAAVTRIDANTFSYIAATDQGDVTSGQVVIDNPHRGKTNLIFRINTLGQQGVSPNYSASQNGPGGNNYRCSYNREVVLLHGGEGWVTGDRTRVRLDSASTTYDYTIEVEDHESTVLNATVNASNNGDGVIRPEPTPFDADTAVTADTIIGGIIASLPPEVSAKHIGNGIYFFSNSNQFQLEVVEDDLMRSFQTSVNDVQNLPNQCKHGYIVKVSNALRSEEDDYYLRFEGQNGKDGTGTWVECAAPGIEEELTNMPLSIQRSAFDNSSQVATFTVRPFGFRVRRVGDDQTNPFPSFVGQRINKVLFFRNRLAILSGENVILSRPGTLGNPDFFIETALTVSASDPIDISAASTFPSELFDGLEVNTGLVVFSTNQQFLLASDDTVLNPDTAKLRSISTYNYNEDIPPISLGTTVAYVDNSGKFSRFNEMANIRREGEPNVVEVSKVVPTLLPKDIDLLTNSRENSIILLGKTDSDTVFGYQYFQVSEQRQQAAWFKWKLNNGLKYHFIINDEYFFLDGDYYLQSIKLVQTENDPSTVQNNVDFLLHLDNYTTVSGGNHAPASNITTFSGVGWLTSVTSPNHELVVIEPSTGRYGKPTYAKDNNGTATATSFTLPGNWSSTTLTIGYIYPYEVKLPTFYPTRQQGNSSRSDINSSLVLHRIKFHFGKIGLYETTLERVGKTNYTEVYESTELDEYEASDAPYIEEFIKTVPVYEKNTNVDITLRSSHPAPATLRSLSWEGDFSPKYYKRV